MSISTIAEIAGPLLLTVLFILMVIDKIVSGKRYREAKQAQVDSLQATIDSKQAEIDTLKQFQSSHVLAEHQAMKSMLESYIERLKEVVAELESEKDKQLAVIADKDKQIATMEAEKDRQAAEANVKQRREWLHVLNGQQRTANAALQLSTQYRKMIENTSLTDLMRDFTAVFPGPPST